MLSMSTSDEKSYHHGDLRSSLLKVGREELEAKGQEALSLREAARKVGVSANAPYRHFPDKEAFLKALAIAGFEELAEASSQEADMAGLGLAYIRFAETNPKLFTLMFSPLLAGCQDADLYESSMKSYLLLLKALGTPDPCHPQAIKAWGLVHGLATLRINGMLRAEGIEGAMEEALRSL
jgi:AcrR family transcriptional regulator